MKTYGQQTSLFTEERLTFLPEDSHVSHIVQPASEKERKMNAISGRKCLEQLERFNQVGSWAKTFAALLIGMEGWYSTRCRLTWKLKATKCFRFYFQLQVSTLRIEEIEFGSLLSTPSSQPMAEITPERAVEKNWIWKNGAYYRADGSKVQTTLSHQLLMLPTPKTTDTNAGRSIINGTQGNYIRVNKDGTKRMGANLADVVGLFPTATSSLGGTEPEGKTGRKLVTVVNHLLPTPTATSDAKGGCTRKDPERQKDTLAHAIHGIVGQTGKTSQLNAQFVAEMMGFPPDWCLSPFLQGEAVEL